MEDRTDTGDSRQPGEENARQPGGDERPRSPVVEIRYTTEHRSETRTGSRPRPSDPTRSATRLRSLAGWIREHTAGKIWWYRLPVVLALAWIFRGWAGEFDYLSVFDGLNLGIHEAGHLFLGWFGNRLLAAAGGTIFQLLAPFAAAIMFYRQRDVFAVTVAGFWLGDNLASIAPYAADARWQLLNLVSPVTGNPEHDWNVILGTLGMLHYDEALGLLFRWSGLITMAAALLGGVQVLWLMARNDGPTRLASSDENERFMEFMSRE